ncbi:MetQ/NlpA family ABC transporter substrate-binding protein [Spelaeicoccus albus]|uniref:D-methionine transport system substrate-binding protein n=1 Tax=Spelaeicoccus albus TaxID=1280376 RepID=A0A7Z0A8C7_9MICO|nr:MetQ/NlpA family ABC transporter substrate-binding protein [Spelaeicoccus albus]NYI66227.1 D-methionine transport system substrate-binding protein [Spelaeicoccus albus]
MRLKPLKWLAIAPLFALMAACGATDSSSVDKTVNLGVTDGAEHYWTVFRNEAKAEGITVKFTNFTDYNQPNPALKQKQLDVNEFQHIQYLANYNVKSHDDLAFIGSTAVYPLPLYSTKYKSVKDIPQGGQVVIPNDAVNEARALLVLQSAGLIKLKNGGTTASTPADIVPGSAKVKVTPVDAAQTTANLHNVAGAVINNNFATSAKVPTSKIIFQVSPKGSASLPYVNGFVVRADDKDNPTYKKLVKIYHSKKVEKAVKSDLGQTGVLENIPAKKLQSETKKIEKQIRAGQ